jgi:tRNA(Ile)-lysidine synthase
MRPARLAGDPTKGSRAGLGEGPGRFRTDMSVIPAEGGLEGATRLLPHGARLLAAVSGGPDSSALLVWLAEGGWDVAAAHFDHALRTGSEQDAEHVARLCRRLGVELFTGRRDQALPRGSLQAAARTLRYGFLEDALRRSGRDLVLLGHTADDVVEGALIHLLRGSGLAGARGMPGRRGPFLRPFLGVWRAELADFLRSMDVQSLDDPANRDVGRFLRARVRHELLPRLEQDSPGFKRRLWGATRSVARLQETLEAQAGALGGERAALRAADRAVRMEAYRQLYGNQPALDRRHLEAMDELTLRGRTGSGLDLPRGLRFRVGRERVEVGQARPPETPPPTLRSRPCPGCGDPSAVHLRAALALRLGYRSPGLRMRPVGSPGSRKLQDILTDARVPRHLRDRLPLVFAEGRLAWVPGIALDADAAAPPGEPAQHVWLDGPGGMVGVPEAALDAYHSS